MNTIIYRFLFVGLFLLALNSCTEPFEFEDKPVFESALVIEARITDQNKIQNILISRSFPLDTIISSVEVGASVQITDETGRTFDFEDVGNGNYNSRIPFTAEQDRSYTLSITTSNGNSYISEPSSIRAKSNIDEIIAVREFKDDLEEGVFIYLNSFDPTNSGNYYLYEYEETYKIITPLSSRGFEAYVVSPLPTPAVDYRLSDEVSAICYSTDNSKKIIQTSTIELGEDRVSRFPVRFIDRENYILSHRYSILVKQFVQSKEAYSYYKTLNTFSSSESLFSQVQTGFLEGNIRSQQNNNEKVIGFFEVNSVSEKRLFFNYEDLFPGEEIPNYIIDCSIVSPPLANEAGQSPIISLIEANAVDFFSVYDGEANPLNFDIFGPFLMTPAGCGDCTRFSSKIVPEFWEE
ncbi:DUF4249 domain-containing protein [uncultured Maribacter sp.]|uniref:DUF4249 domain-containing protein n=1 Tax=uncultured Maribacter sp. TaxID=431308 RepID=UPI002633E486|nr:DUF4249 domain-containing protein [uncultured Maribacter sp.]